MVSWSQCVFPSNSWICAWDHLIGQFFAFSFKIGHVSVKYGKSESKYPWDCSAVCDLVHCPVCMWSVLVALHWSFVHHATTSPHCHCLLLCPSHQCLLSVLLQEFPNSAHLLLSYNPTPSRSQCENITT